MNYTEDEIGYSEIGDKELTVEYTKHIYYESYEYGSQRFCDCTSNRYLLDNVEVSYEDLVEEFKDESIVDKAISIAIGEV